MSARDFPSFHNLENQTVGGWVLHERLGAGMMGAVYRGTKEGLEAAVKVYDPSIVERSREAQHRIQLQLSLKGPTIHPNLIQILDGGICPSTNLWFLVMEYHASRTLMDVLNTLPRHRIRPILAQVAGAARALERRNLAHRNINPSNILITRDYLRTTLLDFGDLAPINASFDDSDSERNLFSPNARYSPPELLTRDEQPTANGWRAVTFYQLGAVLYALIARRPLFAHIDDEPYMQLANAILREAVEVDAETRKALGDDSLIRLMQGCLQKDWSVRLESVTWQDLERADQELSLEESPIHADNPSTADRLARKGFALALAIRLRQVWNECAREAGALGKRGRRWLSYGRKQRRHSGSPNSFILHLHGPWGSGKSSLLAMLRAELQAESRDRRADLPWIVIDFNAWAHQRLAAPWWQLLDNLYRQAADQLATVPGRRVKALSVRVVEWWWRFFTLRRDAAFAVAAAVFLSGLLYVAISATGLADRLFVEQHTLERRPPVAEAIDLLALLGTLVSAAVIVGRSFIFGGVRSAQHFIESSADPMARITSHFDAMLCRIDCPVAIFIDDIDRCQEEYVIRLLEGIQTLFNHPLVVYVVAADRRWLHACYETIYARFQEHVREPGRSLGTLFLEKIFQISVSVPRLLPDTQHAYWRYLIRGREVEVENRLAEARESVRREFTTALTEAEVLSRLTAADTGEDPVRTQARREAAVERLASPRVERTTASFLEEFSHLLAPNPRDMKRLLNAYAIHRDLAILSGLEVLSDIERRRELALWTILSLRWPVLRDYLTERVEGRTPNVDAEIRQLAVAPEVLRVFGGEGVSASLDLKKIGTLVGVATREGSVRPVGA